MAEGKTMSDGELPTVEIDGVTLWPAMVHDGTGYDDEWDKMSEAHLVALLAALPDEQRGRLLLPYVDELKPLASALAERLASFGAEKLAEQRDEARSKVAELERELANAKECAKFVEEHGELTLAVLRDTFSHRHDCFSLERAAADALSRLSRPGTSGGTVKR